MTLVQVCSLLFSLIGIGGYLNYKFWKFPITIGLLIFSACFSVLLIGAEKLGVLNVKPLALALNSLDFEGLLLHGLLSLLLFAGALHIDVNQLKSFKYPIFTYATVGVVVATFLTGYLLYLSSNFLNINIPIEYCFLFGALIAPTDPVSVLSLFKKLDEPNLKIKISGEALFNDGVAIVLFLSLLSIIKTGVFHPTEMIYEIFKGMLGGFAVGIISAILMCKLIKSIDSYELEIMLTLALAFTSYAISEYLGVSAAIATVSAGLYVGDKGKEYAMNVSTREHMEQFWSMLDEIFNAILFVLIGLEMLLISWSVSYGVLGLLAIFAVLLGRYISVLTPTALFLSQGLNIKKTPILLTWGGLRGGISIALALSLPHSPYKHVLISCTYIVVVFSVVVQGLTFGRLLEKIQKK